MSFELVGFLVSTGLKDTKRHREIVREPRDAIASGVSPDKVALWMGDDVITVLKYYCHPEAIAAECPDF
ncbi:MAG: hypothetical protein V7K50_26120 [Nostoc sp.]|uniref:hypothetical protein n=1 Tax=Nostoc sp. TaxID=1180 RepID=UPI002FFCFDC0